MGDRGLPLLRRQLDKIGGIANPAARLLTPLGSAPRKLALLPGAFNPPTIAHLALARAALKQGYEAVLFSLGRVTIDKDESGLPLEDRLHLLVSLAAAKRGLGVMIQNRGLYCEQAEATSREFPAATEIAFIVGMDKLPQIFDPGYYDDFRSALAKLFERSRLLVAPRGEHGRGSLRAILEHPIARPFAHAIDWLPLARRFRDISATETRRRLASGEDTADWLPREVADFLRGAGAFGFRP